MDESYNSTASEVESSYLLALVRKWLVEIKKKAFNQMGRGRGKGPDQRYRGK